MTLGVCVVWYYMRGMVCRGWVGNAYTFQGGEGERRLWKCGKEGILEGHQRMLVRGS